MTCVLLTRANMLLTRANTLPQSPLGVCVHAHPLSRVQLFATLWTVACQAPLSMEFSGQEYWSGQLFLSPGDLPDPGIEARSPVLQMILYHLSHQASHKDVATKLSTGLVQCCLQPCGNPLVGSFSLSW